MAQYSYIGLNSRGQEQRGSIDAENEKAAVRRLREQSIRVMKIEAGEANDLEESLFHKLRRFAGRLHPRRFLPVRAGDRIIFFRQIALMLRAGHTLVSALEAAHQMQVKVGMTRAIERMSDAIRTGASFSVSLAEEKRLFSPMVVSLVAIGEQSGTLESILERLADNFERNRDLRRQLLSAMFYPMTVLLASLGVIVFLVVWVIPRFATFLTARGAALPPSTQLLLDVAGWALDWGLVIGGTTGLVIFLALVAYTTKSGKKVLDRIILALPVIGKAVQLGAMAQTGWTLSLLLRSGIPALDSMRINGEAAGNLAIRGSFEKAADALLEGSSLAKTFEQPHFPLMMRHMASVGESSGQLDTVMYDAGEYYQKELAAKVKLMSMMIEPVMIIVIGLLVGFVYYSMFQALMSVSKGGM